MNPTINDCVLSVATVNGSGSQSANNIILKSLFRMGIPTGGKNLFPSNIAGLPTWFTIRVNSEGYTARRVETDIMIAMNPDTLTDDMKAVQPGGYFIYNSDIKFDTALLRPDVQNYGIPFKKLVDSVTDAIKLKKLLINMIYVGVVAELLEIDPDVLKGVITDNFGVKKTSVIEINLKAIEAGRGYARENIKDPFKFKVRSMDKNKGKIIIDGNSSAALGMLFGGCTFVSWYPITPSSSLAESFSKYANKYRKDKHGKNTFAIVQAEDELASIGMVLGASWAGARAMTTTSGPGISLMSEFAGYSYFAEVPAVLWDIQRVGPSTGLPTRTMQGDLTAVYNLSHGDKRHPILLPGNPQECFEFGQTCFDLAERLQTIVFVLSDLDLGMNFWVSNEFPYPTKPFDRGKVLNEEALEKLGGFQRYKDVDGDGIPYRTLPGTRHPKAAYFTRGSGHTEGAAYTERSEDYKNLMDRLARKYETAREVMPKPVLDIQDSQNKIGIIAFGSTDMAMAEARAALSKDGIKTNYLRVRSIPFSKEVKDFVSKHKTIYVVEQNRDGQMRELLILDHPEHAMKFQSIRHYDGLPIYSKVISDPILGMEKR